MGQHTPTHPAHEVSTMSDKNHVLENRSYWDEYAPKWVAAGERSWSSSEPDWGIWGIPERELGLLPEDMSDMHAIELGCGTAYVSSWMARRGATCTGVDNSSQQLATARRLAEKHSVPLTLLHGNAERVPCPDESFDFAISEYGATTWCDPHRWIPEAHRLLSPGGQLVLLGNTPLAMIATPHSGADSDDRLHRSYFELHRLDWTEVEIEPGGIEFNLPISGWFRLFRETGFEVLDFLELQAPAGANGKPFGTSAEWCRKWPAEQVWKVRKRT